MIRDTYMSKEVIVAAIKVINSMFIGPEWKKILNNKEERNKLIKSVAKEVSYDAVENSSSILQLISDELTYQQMEKIMEETPSETGATEKDEETVSSMLDQPYVEAAEKIDIEKLETYIRNSGVSCIFCGSPNLEVHSALQDSSDSTVIYKVRPAVRCRFCGAKWEQSPEVN